MARLGRGKGRRNLRECALDLPAQRGQDGYRHHGNESQDQRVFDEGLAFAAGALVNRYFHGCLGLCVTNRDTMKDAVKAV